MTTAERKEGEGGGDGSENRRKTEEKRSRRHPRHNLISDLSIDLIERLWPPTRAAWQSTRMQRHQMISFLSFLPLS